MLSHERDDGKDRNGGADKDRQEDYAPGVSAPAPSCGGGKGWGVARTKEIIAGAAARLSRWTARPPSLFLPHHRAFGRTPVLGRAMGGGNAPSRSQRRPESTRLWRPGRPARPRLSEAKRRVPAQRSTWPYWTSVPVCRACTRHRPSQSSPQITLGPPPLRPNHYDKNPCANLCPALDRASARKNVAEGRR